MVVCGVVEQSLGVGDLLVCMLEFVVFGFVGLLVVVVVVHARPGWCRCVSGLTVGIC